MVRKKARAAIACLILVLAGCGQDPKPSAGQPAVGSGLPSEPVAQLPGTVIGPAGGTVTGPNGAQVVIPPGAVSADTTIAVNQTEAGAPPLPVEVAPVGPMFAFTPHGITFAVPVTITVPFDSASVPAGATPTLHKTNAHGQWELVPNSTVAGGTLSAPVSGFSHVHAGVERLAPQRSWEFLVGKTEEIIPGNDFNQPPWQAVHPIEPFPPGTFDLEGDKRSTLEVFSGKDGVTFWAKAEDAGQAFLTQTQGFIKKADDAKLKFIITSAFLEAVDENEPPKVDECPDEGDQPVPCFPIRADIEFSAEAVNKNWFALRDEFGSPVLSVDDMATLEGRNGLWLFDTPMGDGEARFWDKGSFDYTENANRSHAKAVLNRRIEFDVDLSRVKLLDTFFVVSEITVTAWNGRAREAAVRAFLRDPAESGGAIMETSGLELTTDSLPQRPPSAPEPCSTGPDPAAGLLQFSAPTYSLVEGPFAGRSVITVTRSGASKGRVSATVTAGGGTAIPGTHYRPLSTTVHFIEGDMTPRVVPLDILANGDSEPNRTVNLTLSDPGGCATLGGQSNAVLTIVDDDGPVVTAERFTVGGTVSGLTGTGLVLDNNDGLFLEILGNGPFTFVDLPLPSGSPYDVGIFNRPRNPEQNCTIINGKGTFTDHNVTDVRVECV